MTTPTIDLLAEALARYMHAGQTYAGKPYAEAHVAQVVQTFARLYAPATRTELAVAWLHDVLEDCPTTGADLRGAGIPGEVVDAVRVLTHRTRERYGDYLLRVAAHGGIAARVKVADALTNASHADSGRRAGRYRQALLALRAHWPPAFVPQIEAEVKRLGDFPPEPAGLASG